MAKEFDPYHKWLGIPPKHQPPDHYRLLGIERFEADADVISLAADQRMQYLRTFQNGERAKTSQQLLNEVAAARVCLLDAGAKAAYDRQLARQVDTEPESTWPIDARQDDNASDAELNWSRTETSDPVKTRRSLPSRDRRPQQRIIFLALTLVIVGTGTTFILQQNKTKEAARQTEIARRDAAQRAAEAEQRAKQETERKVEAERQAKEESQRKAKKEADRKAAEEAVRRAKEEEARKEKKAQEQAKRKAEEEAQRKAKEEAEQKAKAEAKLRVKQEAARRARQASEREANEAKYLRTWFERNFEQTNTGWAPVMRDDLQQSMENLKKSKNKLSKSLQQSQSSLRLRKNLIKSLRKAEKAKNDFKPKKEAASSRIRRVKKIEEALTSAQNKMTANSDRLKGKKTEIVAQVRAFQSDILICRTQNAKITALRHHRYTDRFVEANGLKMAPPLSPSTFKVEIKKAGKLLEKANEVQVDLQSIE